MPQKIYEKDKKEFGLTPANLSDIKSDQIYLVKNLTFLNSVVSFVYFVCINLLCLAWF